ncbi:MAG: MoaD/ThiS family protein [candidate division NC10 bacterium]|nr:MoaD/ThiS family protein [candidate division NC10 bacterium]
MKIRVKCFAAAREIVGTGELVVELPEGSTVTHLLEQVRRQFPRLEGLAGSLLFSVNREYAPSDKKLAAGDEVALIPPVSGGVDV